MNNNKFPLTALVITATFSWNVHAQTFIRNADRVMRRGVGLEFSKPRVAAFDVYDSLGKQATNFAGAISKPIRVDGAELYAKPIKQPALPGKPDHLHDHIFANLDSALRQLPDGDYRLKLRDLVVDKNGRIVFFGYEGIRNADEHTAVALETQRAVFDRLCAAIEKLAPFKDVKHTPVFIDDADLWDARFQVYNHEVFYHPKK